MLLTSMVRPSDSLGDSRPPARRGLDDHAGFGREARCGSSLPGSRGLHCRRGTHAAADLHPGSGLV